MASTPARQASRRNGAKSRGPRTPAGKAVSARNAVKHGLRARQAIRPEDLPGWARAIEANLAVAVGSIGHDQRVQLDRLLSVLVLIDLADRELAVELARLLQMVSGAADGNASVGAALSNAQDILSTLRKLHAYRSRFRAQRDMCIRRIIRQREA